MGGGGWVGILVLFFFQLQKREINDKEGESICVRRDATQGGSCDHL